MKTRILTVLFLVAVTVVSAQKKNYKKMAQNVTNEMKEVLSLDQEQCDALFPVHLDKITEIETIKLDAKLSEDEKKEAIDNQYKAASKKFTEILGKETMKKWYAYIKQKYA